LFLLLFLGGLPDAAAQSNGTLTAEFARMSAKERAKVARQEQAEAASDTLYQGIMERAESLFQAQRYDDALLAYEPARDRRPLNVYPKVRIEDLQVLLRKREEEMERTMMGTISSDPVNGPAARMDTTIAPPRVVAGPERTVGIAPAGSRKDAPPATMQPSEERTPRLEKERSIPVVPPLRDSLPDGIIENRYQQGSAEVTEIFVTESGRTRVFKRVVHKWGQVFYFEDGQAIDGRVWRQRFGDRP
jgi:hypothetical protein